MARINDEIYVKIIADTQKATQNVEGFSKSIRNSIQPLKDMARTIRTVLTAGGVGILVQQGFRMIAQAMGEMQVAAEKAIPSLAKMHGSLTEWKKVMDEIKVSQGAVVTTAFAPLRAAIIDVYTEAQKANVEINKMKAQYRGPGTVTGLPGIQQLSVGNDTGVTAGLGALAGNGITAGLGIFGMKGSQLAEYSAEQEKRLAELEARVNAFLATNRLSSRVGAPFLGKGASGDTASGLPSPEEVQQTAQAVALINDEFEEMAQRASMVGHEWEGFDEAVQGTYDQFTKMGEIWSSMADSLVSGDVTGAFVKLGQAALAELTKMAMLAAATAAWKGDYLTMAFWLGVAGVSILGSSGLGAIPSQANGGATPSPSSAGGRSTTIIVQGSVISENQLGAVAARGMGDY